jgi:hypothetical protein
VAEVQKIKRGEWCYLEFGQESASGQELPDL